MALAKGGPGSVRVMFCVKRFVTVTTIVVSGPEEKLKEEVGPALMLVGAADVELTKKALGSATSAATLVTKVVISGPGDVVAAVVFELAVAVLFGKKAPGELAATAIWGKGDTQGRRAQEAGRGERLEGPVQGEAWHGEA